MDQKEIVQKATTDTTTTVKNLLVFLSKLSGEGLVDWFQQMTPLEGEVDIHKFLSRNPYAQAIPLDQRVNLEQFKSVFKEYNIAFAFKKVEEGTELYVRYQDKKVAELACEKIFKDIITKKVDINEYTVDKNQQTFQEKVQEVSQKLGAERTLPEAKMIGRSK